MSPTTTEPTVVLGVNGFAGAGKDTFADILVEKYGFVKMAFADPMREIAMAIDPIVHLGVVWADSGGDEFLGERTELADGFGLRTVRYSDALEEVGYNEAKFKYPEIRNFLQRLGTEAGRNILGEDFWADLAMKRSSGYGRVVLADCRFQNEAHAIRRRAGHVIRIERPGVEAANDHPSEHDLDGFPFSEVVHNNGTIEDLEWCVDKIIETRFNWVLRNPQGDGFAFPA